MILVDTPSPRVVTTIALRNYRRHWGRATFEAALPEATMHIAHLVEAIQHNRIRITDHADEEAQADRLSYDEIFNSVLHGRVIKDYPDDKPYPSCLVYGNTFSGEPLHSVWAYDSETGWAVMITTYRPDPTRWIDWDTRRPTDEILQ